MIYVGRVAGAGEAFGLLSDIYGLPAAFFDLELRAFQVTKVPTLDPVLSCAQSRRAPGKAQR